MGFTRLATWEILDVSHQLKQRPIQTRTALCVKWLFHDLGGRGTGKLLANETAQKVTFLENLALSSVWSDSFGWKVLIPALTCDNQTNPS